MELPVSALGDALNSIVFRKEELEPDGTLALNGERALHLVKIKKASAGTILRLGEIDGPSGIGTVLEVSRERIVIGGISLENSPQQPKVDLVLALPRPQIFKRVLQAAATMGVGVLFVVGSEKVEKSFFASPVLAPAELERNLRLGLEQGCRTGMPVITVVKKLHLLEEHIRSVDEKKRRLLAEPRAEHFLSQQRHGGCSSLAAIGPEGGFTEREVSFFSRLGFEPVRISEFTLRVDQAVSGFLAQLELIGHLGN